MINIFESDFPDGHGLKVGFWLPVLFSYNFDTPERLVVAVISYIEGAWHLETANSLDKLKCLYGREATVATEVINLGLRDIEAQLQGQGIDDLRIELSGLSLGIRMEGQSTDTRSLARRWLGLISSLHNRNFEPAYDYETPRAVPVGRSDPIFRDISKDRLAVLVMEKMVLAAPQFRSHFSSHVRKLERDHSARLLTHKAYVAYDGPKIAANFTTLKAGRNKISVDIAKRLMWDLEQHRDSNDDNLFTSQAHEIFLYHPMQDDPTITEKQFENVMEVVETLTDEGSKRDIHVRSHDSVAEISKRLLEEEGYQ